MKKRGDLAIGELVTIILAIATLALGIAAIKSLEEKKSDILDAGTGANLISTYEIFVNGKLREGERLAAYPSTNIAKSGETSFFVLGVKNTEPGTGNFALKIDGNNFAYNKEVFRLEADEAKLFTIGFDPKDLKKGQYSFRISALNPENIYATSDVLFNIE